MMDSMVDKMTKDAEKTLKLVKMLDDFIEENFIMSEPSHTLIELLEISPRELLNVSKKLLKYSKIQTENAINANSKL